jgi:hypothetical protein
MMTLEIDDQQRANELEREQQKQQIERLIFDYEDKVLELTENREKALRRLIRLRQDLAMLEGLSALGALKATRHYF